MSSQIRSEHAAISIKIYPKRITKDSCLTDVLPLTESQEQYLTELMPALIQVIELFEICEKKYGNGIKLTNKDKRKTVTHSVKSLIGMHNQDGKSHAVATASRALKAVLAEVEDANN